MSTGRVRNRFGRRLRRILARFIGFILTGRVFNKETMWTLRRRNRSRVKKELAAFSSFALVASYFMFVVPADVRGFLETGWLLILSFVTLPFVLQYIAAKILVNLEYPGNDLVELRKAIRQIRSNLE